MRAHARTARPHSHAPAPRSPHAPPYTHTQEPWGDKKPLQIMSLVGVMGHRLPLPRNPPHPDCPPAYLNTIADCWAPDPAARPPFSALVRRRLHPPPPAPGEPTLPAKSTKRPFPTACAAHQNPHSPPGPTPSRHEKKSLDSRSFSTRTNGPEQHSQIRHRPDRSRRGGTAARRRFERMSSL